MMNKYMNAPTGSLSRLAISIAAHANSGAAKCNNVTASNSCRMSSRYASGLRQLVNRCEQNPHNCESRCPGGA